MGTSPDSSELWGPPGGQRGIALTRPRLGQGVPEKDRERGNTHHSRLREMSGERWRSPSPLERRREPPCQSRGSISSRVSAPNVRFFLVANEIKTARQTWFEGGTLLCAPSGEVLQLRRGESGKLRPGQGSDGFYWAPLGVGESLSWRVVAGFYWVLLGVRKVGRTGFGFPLWFRFTGVDVAAAGVLAGDSAILGVGLNLGGRVGYLGGRVGHLGCLGPFSRPAQHSDLLFYIMVSGASTPFWLLPADGRALS